MRTYKGSCHCGLITFQFVKPKGIEQLIDCNCSICRKKGLLHTPVENDEMTILTGEDQLSLYQFGTKTAKYWFCPKCGVEPFHRSRGNPHRYSVNTRCLDDCEEILATTEIWFIDARVHPMDQGSTDFPLRSNPYREAGGTPPDFVTSKTTEKT